MVSYTRRIVDKYHCIVVGVFCAVVGVIASEVPRTPTICRGLADLVELSIYTAPWYYAHPRPITVGLMACGISIVVIRAGAHVLFLWWKVADVVARASYYAGTVCLPLFFRPWKFESRMAWVSGVVVVVMVPVYQILKSWLNFVPTSSLLQYIPSAWSTLIILTLVIGGAVVLRQDKKKAITHDAGYILVLGFVCSVIPFGLRNLYVVLIKFLPPALVLVVWTVLLHVMQRLFVALADQSVGGEYEMVFVFPLQFTDDMFCSLIFSRIAFPSVPYFTSLFVFTVRDILRDTGFWGVARKWITRVKRGTHADAITLTQICYLSGQNLVSELCAGIVYVSIVLTELVLDQFGAWPHYFTDPAGTDQMSTLYGSLVYVGAEVFIHIVVIRVLQWRVRRLVTTAASAPYVVRPAMNTWASEVADIPRSTPVPRPDMSGTVLDPSWDLAEALDKYFRENVLYLDIVVMFVIWSTLSNVATVLSAR